MRHVTVMNILTGRIIPILEPLLELPVFADLVGRNFRANGGEFTGDGTATINNTFDWISGFLNSASNATGKLVIVNGAALTVSSNNYHYLGYNAAHGRIIENSGQATWFDGGPISTTSGRWRSCAARPRPSSVTGPWRRW